MTTEIVVTIASVIVGLAGFLFGIYKYRSTRKVAQILYETCEFSDFKIPPEFLKDIQEAPLMIRVESTGNKRSEDVIIALQTTSRITDHTIASSEKYEADVGDQQIHVRVDKMNPNEDLQLILRCQGPTGEKHIKAIKVTHSEGAGIDKKSRSFQRIPINLLFCGLEYNLHTRRICLARIGPWRFQGEERLL